uniref:DUF834 domain-containing protein n=1 Tax=Oryza nivara TaxID=4536 RepID=A0A0E0I2R1_ORYNI
MSLGGGGVEETGQAVDTDLAAFPDPDSVAARRRSRDCRRPDGGSVENSARRRLVVLAAWRRSRRDRRRRRGGQEGIARNGGVEPVVEAEIVGGADDAEGGEGSGRGCEGIGEAGVSVPEAEFGEGGGRQCPWRR